MAQEIAKRRETQAFTYPTERGDVTLTMEVVRKRFCPKASEMEIYEFLQFCRYHQLNPYLKEVYLIKYGDSDPAAIVVDYTQFIKRARTAPEYNGYESGLIVSRNDIVEDTRGAFKLPSDELLGAWCRVHLKGEAFPVEVRLNIDEVMQKTRSGDPNRFWKRMPNQMAEKTAIAAAHRRAMQEVQGMYVESEGAELAGMDVDPDTGEIIPAMEYAEMPASQPFETFTAEPEAPAEPAPKPKPPRPQPAQGANANGWPLKPNPKQVAQFWETVDEARVPRSFAENVLEGQDPGEWVKANDSTYSHLIEIVTTAWREFQPEPESLLEGAPPEFAG